MNEHDHRGLAPLVVALLLLAFVFAMTAGGIVAWRVLAPASSTTDLRTFTIYVDDSANTAPDEPKLDAVPADGD